MTEQRTDKTPLPPHRDASNDEEDEDCYSEYSSDEGEPATSAGDYALSKSEANNFQNAIRKYCDQCVEAEKGTRTAQAAAETAAMSSKSTKTEIDVVANKVKSNCEGWVSKCEKHCETVSKRDEDVKKMHAEVVNMYDKVLFAAAHAEESIRQAMKIFTTATEILSTNNELVHKTREIVGNSHYPFKLTSDLTAIEKNISDLQLSCKRSKVMMRYSGELSSAARRVSAMELFLSTEMEKEKAEHGDRNKDDGVDHCVDGWPPQSDNASTLKKRRIGQNDKKRTVVKRTNVKKAAVSPNSEKEWEEEESVLAEGHETIHDEHDNGSDEDVVMVGSETANGPSMKKGANKRTRQSKSGAKTGEPSFDWMRNDRRTHEIRPGKGRNSHGSRRRPARPSEDNSASNGNKR